MSPSVDAMAHSTSSHNLSPSQNSSTDSMGMFTGSKNGNGISRFFKRKLKGLKRDDQANVPAPIDTKTANTDTGPNRPRKGPKTIVPKPGINRTESERRDKLVEAPLSPSEKRLQRQNPRGTSTSLAPIQSRSVGDLNEGNNDHNIDNRRGSYVDPKLSSPHTPISYSRNSHSQPSTSATATTAATTVATHSPPERQSENQLERQITAASTYDNQSVYSRSNYGGTGPGGTEPALIDDAPDWKWILNLSMHFRDHADREKFFVTYAETPKLRRRVTVSCDYRHPESGSLEEDLKRLKSQKEKSNRIYDSIKEALADIQFYETTTNLKLHTHEGRLNVHVTEDMHEIIYYPHVNAIAHLDCPKIRESDLIFDSHLSGFVYKVWHGNQVFIKKEIPSPDTVDEFLYEINALYALRDSKHVIKFGGCVLDDKMEKVKGLLISFAPKGALIDILYNEREKLPWELRESWARQIVAGLADIHEGGYVQGDFTLSNIVIDEDDTAKIIDINRRGCPVGWEPPEITEMIDGLQRIGIYIGVKSDIFQLGMCLWAIAMEHDEPEYEKRPLSLRFAPPNVPDWYKDIVDLCLAPTPQARPGAKELLSKFPKVDASHSNGTTPLSPVIVSVAPFDLSSPPSPAIPQPHPEYIQMNGLKYEIPLPVDIPSPNVNMVDSEENYERYEAGIEQNTKLEDEMIRPMDEIVDDVEPVTTQPSRDAALAAASAAWAYGNGAINGGIKGNSGNGVAGKPLKPTLDIPHSAANGKPNNGYSGVVKEDGKGKSSTTLAAAKQNITSAQAAEKALKGSSVASGRNSPIPARHTDSGFAEVDESPVSPKTIPGPRVSGVGGRKI